MARARLTFRQRESRKRKRIAVCRKNTIATFNHIFPKWAPKWSWPVIEKIPKHQQKQWLGD
jgi:hypothetical protein